MKSLFLIPVTFFLSACNINTVEKDVAPGFSVIDPDQKTPATKLVSTKDFSLFLSSQSSQSTISVKDYSDDATIVQGIGVADLFDNGQNDIFLCSTTYRNFLSHPVVILRANNGGLKNVTNSVFNGNVPTTNQCTMPIFKDLNGDGKKDVIYSEAGRDAPPWTGTAVEVALNTGNNLSRITEMFEEKVMGIRSYATAAGNLDRDPFGEIVLSSGTDAKKSVILEFDGDLVSVKPNKFSQRGIWDDASNSTNMQVADFDNDGKQDIYLGGSWYSHSNRIIWSGLLGNGLAVLPDTPLGFTKDVNKKSISGADITSSAVADFDNDGDLDIVNVYEKVSGNWKGNSPDLKYGASAIQVLEQTKRRKFEISDNLRDQSLGMRYYLTPIIFDLNNDGYDDIIINYWRKAGDWKTQSLFSATIFMNKGGLNFTIIDASKISGYSNNLKGMIFPLQRSSRGTKVAVLQHYSGSGASMNRRLVSYTAELSAK